MNFKDIEALEMFQVMLVNEPEWETLQDKTQVFNQRITDDVKSRGSHCGDVAKISETLVRGLSGDDVEAKRAYLLGLIHDLGHIPYGHAGESVADSMIAEHDFSQEEIDNITEIRKLIFGEEYVENLKGTRKNSKYPKNICFEHNENSVLRYITLCKEFEYEVDKDIIICAREKWKPMSTQRYARCSRQLCS